MGVGVGSGVAVDASVGVAVASSVAVAEGAISTSPVGAHAPMKITLDRSRSIVLWITFFNIRFLTSIQSLILPNYVPTWVISI